MDKRKRTGFSRKFRYKERDASYEMADFEQISMNDAWVESAALWMALIVGAHGAELDIREWTTYFMCLSD